MENPGRFSRSKVMRLRGVSENGAKATPLREIWPSGGPESVDGKRFECDLNFEYTDESAYVNRPVRCVSTMGFLWMRISRVYSVLHATRSMSKFLSNRGASETLWLYVICSMYCIGLHEFLRGLVC